MVKLGYIRKEDGHVYGELKSAREGADYGLDGFREQVVRDLIARARVLVAGIGGLI